MEFRLPFAAAPRASWGKTWQNQNCEAALHAMPVHISRATITSKYSQGHCLPLTRTQALRDQLMRIRKQYEELTETATGLQDECEWGRKALDVRTGYVLYRVQ